jgi:hypothetical protein
MFLMAVTLRLQAEMPQSLQQAVANGLRWYFHWMKPLPEGADAMKCRGVEVDDSDFVYCTPGKVTLELTNSPRSKANVEFIGSTSDEYPKAVNWFRELHGAQTRQSFETSLRVVDLAPYEIDEDHSKAWMETTRVLMANTLGPWSHDHHQLRLLFPWVSKGDPAYQVYLTVDGRVESIWEFRVIDGVAQGYKRWVYDQPHHSIPASAQSFSEDPRRWYKVVVENRQEK